MQCGWCSLPCLPVCQPCCFTCSRICIQPDNQTFEGYLGRTIDLSGVSYNSKEVYLFMTGPGLPDDGVTLTDTTKLASQGQFTMIDVDSSQQWSMKWDTSRIENNIDPGTYTVYVVNAPVDKSNLAGHSYQALIVYLKDTGTRTSGQCQCRDKLHTPSRGTDG